MKKLISAFIIIFVLITSNTFAGEIPKEYDLTRYRTSISESLEKEKKLSLEDSIKLVEMKTYKDPLYTKKFKEYNRIQEINIQNYGQPVRKVNDEGEIYYEYPYGTPNYNVTQKMKDIEDTFDTSKKIAKTNIKNLYFSIIDTRKEIEIANDKLEISIDELERIKVQLSLGVATKEDLSRKETDVAFSKVNYEEKIKTLENLYNKFELETDIKKLFKVNLSEITFDISYLLLNTRNMVDTYVVPINLDKNKMNMYKSLKDLKTELMDKEEALDKATNGYSKDSAFYEKKSEELGIRALKDSVEDSERNLGIDYLKDSQNLTNLIDSFQNKHNALEIERKKYEQAISKYNIGQIKQIDLIKQKLAHDEEWLKHNNALKEVYFAVDNYNDKYNLK